MNRKITALSLVLTALISLGNRGCGESNAECTTVSLSVRNFTGGCVTLWVHDEVNEIEVTREICGAEQSEQVPPGMYVWEVRSGEDILRTGRHSLDCGESYYIEAGENPTPEPTPGPVPVWTWEQGFPELWWNQINCSYRNAHSTNVRVTQAFFRYDCIDPETGFPQSNFWRSFCGASWCNLMPGQTVEIQGPFILTECRLFRMSCEVEIERWL